MRLPDFLGIGTQKGGTTYLHGLLQQHPQVWMAHPKELHYFSLHYGQGLDWYANHFADASVNQLCGEVTPYYLFHPLAAERIHSVLPDVKLIVLLRDPVERALSQFFHSRRLGFEPLELEAAFDAESERLAEADVALKRGDSHLGHQQHSYLSRSRYEKQLLRFKELFAPEQLLVMRSEDFFVKPQEVWWQVLQFFGLYGQDLPIQSSLYRGDGEAEQVSSMMKKKLQQQLLLTYEFMESTCLFTDFGGR